MFLIVGRLLLQTGQSYSQVVLSEIMFDAVGSDAHDEFVEIVNLSETVTVDLMGWQISDGVGFDQIVPLEADLTLEPGQFAVILDASYIENSDTYDNLIPENSLIVTIDNQTFGSGGFLNSVGETVSLINAEGVVVSEYVYSVGNESGFSDEKIDLRGSNEPENWSDSKTLFGTPGGFNSVSPLSFDLAILPEDLVFSPNTLKAGASVTIEIKVRNLGVEPATNFSTVLFEDLNGDFVPGAGEELAAPFEFDGTLGRRDSTTFTVLLENLSSGLHAVSARIEFDLDEDLTNNLATGVVLVGFEQSSVVINELMYSPFSDEAEWVEIMNRSSNTIDLSNWMFSDSDSSDKVLIAADILLRPDDFLVLAQDSSFLNTFSPPANSFRVIKNWPNLNNDLDSVVLYDLTGFTIDRVNYSSSWGGDRGISLERISPDLASNESSNWSSSAAFEGGTPGLQNSIFTRALLSATTLTVAPNPFSPDGDGSDDFAVISYEIPVNTATVNLKIYDVRGRLIRFLVNNSASGSRNAFIWDGKDNEDQMARMGLYIVFLQALNAQAGVLQTAKKTLVLAGKL